jgi:hypothetical protein
MVIVMRKRKRPASTSDLKSLLTRDVGYVWTSPSGPSSLSNPPTWVSGREEMVEATVASLVQFEWRVAHMREQIEAMGADPHGRTRQGLAEQLTEAYLDTERLRRAFDELSEDERRFYVNMLLQSRLQGLQAFPDYRALQARPSQQGAGLAQRIIRAGLAILSEGGRLYIPYDAFAWLPDLSVSFPTVSEPKRFTPAADPRVVLAHIQLLLGVLQAERLTLRDRPFWQPKEHPYAKSIMCWPPTPKDAKVLQKQVDRERDIELFYPLPYLDGSSLRTLVDALDATTDYAEFLYHTMINLGLVLSGNPVTLDEARVQAWMALPPGDQLGAIFRLSRYTASWASWWKYWRSGEVQVRHEYYGYWNLSSFRDNVHRTSMNLRWILLDILSFLPEEGWLEIQNLAGWLAELFPDPTTHQYMGGLRPGHAEEGWTGFLRAALVALVAGPLHAMGFVDVAPSPEDVRYIRLHGLSDVQWGRLTEVPITTDVTLTPEVVHFFPEEGILEIVTPVPPNLTSALLTWAKPAGFSQNVMRYRLDVEQLHASLEAGMDSASLAEAWREGAGFDPLPEIVAWWQAWEGRYGRVRLYPNQALLQTRDAFTMQELQVALPKLQTSMLGMITPAAALVKPDEVDQILSDLERQGYMPKETT